VVTGAAPLTVLAALLTILATLLTVLATLVLLAIARTSAILVLSGWAAKFAVRPDIPMAAR
jgi:hypothetical protein